MWFWESVYFICVLMKPQDLCMRYCPQKQWDIMFNSMFSESLFCTLIFSFLICIICEIKVKNAA